MDDLQLGVAIARVYSGTDSQVVRDLLQTKVLPAAATNGDRWQAHWAFWMLGKRDSAVRALLVSHCSHLTYGSLC